MIYYGKTDCGRVRSENQDTFGYEEMQLKCIGKTALLAVVCDGMGGAAGGQVASSIACDSFIKYVVRQIEAFDEDLSNPENIPFEKILRDGVKIANKNVYDAADSDRNYKGMGTTLAAVLYAPPYIFAVNIGDSRIYGVYGDTLLQLSHDHSYVQSLVDSGQITEQQAIKHPKKNVILRAVGVAPNAEPDVFTVSDAPDALILCSDGLSNMVLPELILTHFAESSPLEEKIDALIKEANDAGGYDNITVFTLVTDKQD